MMNKKVIVALLLSTALFGCSDPKPKVLECSDPAIIASLLSEVNPEVKESLQITPATSAVIQSNIDKTFAEHQQFVASEESNLCAYQYSHPAFPAGIFYFYIEKEDGKFKATFLGETQ